MKPRQAGDLPAYFRLAYQSEIREGLTARGKRPPCPYKDGTPKARAWRYGNAWAERRKRPRLPPFERPPVVVEIEPHERDRRTRPRLTYRCGGVLRIAIGRRGESVDSLAAEIARCYPQSAPAAVPLGAGRLRVLGEYAAGWIANAATGAARMGVRKSAFLELAKDADLIAAATSMHEALNEQIRSYAGDDDWDSHARRTPQRDSTTTDGKIAGMGIGKVAMTGEFTKSGKPKLSPIGRELSFRGCQLRLYEQLPLRWTEEQLIGIPVAADWGTREREPSTSTVKNKLATNRSASVLFFEGMDAEAHCLREASQPHIPKSNSFLILGALNEMNGRQQFQGLGTRRLENEDIGCSAREYATSTTKARGARYRCPRPELEDVYGWSFLRGPEFDFDDQREAA